eukprot:m.15821 g.15821  ORF g.15821 m.15821 type:complete len:711 (+) comp26574_c0_seq1:484-2616(+)
MSIPSWKQALLDKKRKQEEDEQRRKQEEETKRKSIPAWKRAMLERKDKESTKPTSTAKPHQPAPSTATAAPSKPKPEPSTAPNAHENAPKANGWLRTSETTSKNVTIAPDSPPKNLRQWPKVTPSDTLGRSPPTKLKRDVDASTVTPTSTEEKSPPIRLLERKLSYEREVAKASPPANRKSEVEPKKESPLVSVKANEIAPPPAAPDVDKSGRERENARPKRGSVRSLLGKFQGAAGGETAKPSFFGRRTSPKSVESSSVPLKERKSETPQVQSVMPAKVESKVNVEVVPSVPKSVESVKWEETNAPKATQPTHLTTSDLKAKVHVADVSSPALKPVEIKANREEQVAVKSPTPTLADIKASTEEQSVGNKANRKEQVVESLGIKPIEVKEVGVKSMPTSVEIKPKAKEEVVKKGGQSVAPEPQETKSIEAKFKRVSQPKEKADVKAVDDVRALETKADVNRKAQKEQTEDVEELKVTSIDDNDDALEPVAKQKELEMKRKLSATHQEPVKRADVSSALGQAGMPTPDKKKHRRRSSLTDPTKPKPQGALKRRVSFNHENLTTEHYYPKAVYEDLEESPDVGRRPMAVNVPDGDLPKDATERAVYEQRSREAETGLSLKPHPSLTAEPAPAPSRPAAQPIGNSPNNFLFGSSSLYSYQPKHNKYVQDTLQKKKKKKDKDKDKDKKEQKKPVQEERIDYTKLNEETAAMLW